MPAAALTRALSLASPSLGPRRTNIWAARAVASKVKRRTFAGFLQVRCMALPMGHTLGGDEMRTSFSWPLRVFLTLFVGNMLVGSFLSLTPAQDEWFDEFDMATAPEASLADDPSRVAQAVLAYLDPTQATNGDQHAERKRRPLESSVTWLATRLEFFEGLAGIDQGWPMFSPDVATESEQPRFELLYADGEQRTVRVPTDPRDPTKFFRLFAEKPLQLADSLLDDVSVRRGYAAWLARTFAFSRGGAPVVEVVLRRVDYEFPAPGSTRQVWIELRQRDIEWRFTVATQSGQERGVYVGDD